MANVLLVMSDRSLQQVCGEYLKRAGHQVLGITLEFSAKTLDALGGLNGPDILIVETHRTVQTGAAVIEAVRTLGIRRPGSEETIPIIRLHNGDHNAESLGEDELIVVDPGMFERLVHAARLLTDTA